MTESTASQTTSHSTPLLSKFINRTELTRRITKARKIGEVRPEPTINTDRRISTLPSTIQSSTSVIPTTAKYDEKNTTIPLSPPINDKHGSSTSSTTTEKLGSSTSSTTTKRSESPTSSTTIKKQEPLISSTTTKKHESATPYKTTQKLEFAASSTTTKKLGSSTSSTTTKKLGSSTSSTTTKKLESSTSSTTTKKLGSSTSSTTTKKQVSSTLPTTTNKHESSTSVATTTKPATRNETSKPNVSTTTRTHNEYRSTSPSPSSFTPSTPVTTAPKRMKINKTPFDHIPSRVEDPVPPEVLKHIVDMAHNFIVEQWNLESQSFKGEIHERRQFIEARYKMSDANLDRFKKHPFFRRMMREVTRDMIEDLKYWRKYQPNKYIRDTVTSRHRIQGYIGDYFLEYAIKFGKRPWRIPGKNKIRTRFYDEVDFVDKPFIVTDEQIVTKKEHEVVKSKKSP